MSFTLRISQDQAEFLSEVLLRKRHGATLRAKSAKARKTRRLALDDENLAAALIRVLHSSGYNDLPKADAEKAETPEPQDDPKVPDTNVF